MHSRNRVSYSNEQKLFWVKLFKESHFSGKDAKLRFLNHVHYEARLKAGEFYDQFKKKKGYQIPPIDTFRRWLGGGKRSLESTNLENKDSKRMKNRHGKYPLLDDLICEFVMKSQSHLSEHGFGLSWGVIQSQARIFAKTLYERNMMSEDEYNSFKASRGYLYNLKRRRDLATIRLQGEGGTMPDDEVNALMIEFSGRLKTLMEKYNVTDEYIFNADQTALYYKRFPSSTVASKENVKDMKGTKAMKSKDRITQMVCTSSVGKKCPMAYVGTSKKPRCFVEASSDIMKRYTSNKCAWFNQSVTQWWFKDVFAPWFDLNVRQNKCHCIMILDNCSAHNDIDSWLLGKKLEYIHVIYLPPNVTSKGQPMDQGIISWLKTKYRYSLVHDLLSIYSDEEKRTQAVQTRRGGGYDGIRQGLKPNLFDAIIKMDKLWEEVHEEIIIKCWRKAKCLPSPLVSDADTAFDYDSINSDLADAFSSLRLNFNVRADSAARNDFAGTLFNSNNSELNCKEVVIEWNKEDLDDRQDIIDTCVDEMCEDIVDIALNRAEVAHADVSRIENIDNRDRSDDIEVCTTENVVENELNEADDFLEELDSDKIFDKLQSHIDDVGKILSFVNRKESFGDSDKVVELVARMKQLTLACNNTLTDLNGYRGQIKRAKMKQGKISSFFHPKE